MMMVQITDMARGGFSYYYFYYQCLTIIYDFRNECKIYTILRDSSLKIIVILSIGFGSVVV